MIMPTDTDAAAGVCDVCGSPDRLGIGTCVACARAGSDALLYLEAPERRADRRVIEAWLVGALDGVVSRSDAREIADGFRPVVGLPAAAARRAVDALGLRGVPATWLPPERAWRRVPPLLLVLAGLSGGAGLFAGLSGTPILAVLGPLLSALLVVVAIRRLRVPVWLPEPVPSALGLPDSVEPEVMATLETLAPGSARDRLRSLATLAAAVCREGGPEPDEARTEAAVDLMRLACDAALDLDALERSLDLLEAEASGEGRSRAVEEAMAGAHEAREAVADGLDAAEAALVSARAAGADAVGGMRSAAERLRQQSREPSAAWRDGERHRG